MYSSNHSELWYWMDVGGEFYSSAAWEKSSWNPVSRKLNGPHSQSKCFEEDKSWPCQELNHDSSVVLPVTYYSTDCTILVPIGHHALK
jgi:hypothetical protein